MQSFINTFFGPLDKKYCMYYFLLTIIFFILLVLAIGAEIIFLFKRYKQLNSKTLISGLLLLFNAFLAYFVNRLLYTMCSKSLI